MDKKRYNLRDVITFYGITKTEKLDNNCKFQLVTAKHLHLVFVPDVSFKGSTNQNDIKLSIRLTTSTKQNVDTALKIYMYMYSTACDQVFRTCQSYITKLTPW